MKIEVGEHLMRSWLRHVEGCQVAELNWKSPSPEHDVHTLQPILDAARSRLGDDVFGNRPVAQWLRQAEVDVLGIRVKPSTGQIAEVYAVDVAFHENGLGYEDNEGNIRKKIIRSSIIIQSVFGSVEQHLIFASPVVRGPDIDRLRSLERELREFTGVQNIPATVAFYMEESFREAVLCPLLRAARDVTDTSQLFMRSYKMLAHFGDVISAICAACPPGAAEAQTGSPDAGPGPRSDPPILRFEFDPAPADRFKRELLEKRRARIITHYTDGRTTVQVWDASNFTASSNLLGNLRTRSEFRQGNWQRAGISHVKVEILPGEGPEPAS